jgi:enterochelin esterase-like enzyme
MKIQRLVFGVLALVGLIGANSSAQTPECASRSQRLAALETDLKGNQNAESLKAFWKDVENVGTPIVERIPNDQAEVLVTFVWRGSSSAKQVFIFPQIESTAATEKMKMNRLRDTNLWYKTYCLPEDSRFTYGFYEAPTLVENDSPLSHVDQLKPDQFNSRRFEFPPHDSVEGGTTVVFSLFESPHSPGRSWSTVDAAARGGTVETKTILSKVLGKQRRVWVYRSPPNVEGAKPPALLILFDGFDYLHEIPAPTILDNLVRTKQIPGFVAVLVDNPPQTRTQDLLCSDRFDEFVATELAPWAREQYGVSPNPGQAIVGGSSLGGLAAACTALRYPEVFGNVLSESGAFWWSPQGEKQGEWVAQRVASSKPVPIKWHLDVGVFEDVPAPNGGSVTNLAANRHLRDVLRARGYAVDYSEFSGGHEFVNWQSSMAFGLIHLCRDFPTGQMR